ncbi:hypothetical protein [Streptomyces sp. NPDC001221]
MTIALFAPDREAEPPTFPTICQIFRWIGQTFESCEDCERPFWDHLYEPPFSGAKPIFRVKQYAAHRKTWVWAPVGRVITRQRADACRDKWDGYTAWVSADGGQR